MWVVRLRGEGTVAIESRLTAEQVKQFKMEGYLIIEHPVLTPTEFDGLKQHYEDKLTV